MKRLVTVLFFSAASLAVLLYGYHHPYFKIKDIAISGHNFVPKEKLYETLAPLYHENVVAGVMGMPERILMRAYAQLRDVDVTVTFPDKLHIAIHEKDPWVIFVGEKQRMVISRDGTVLNRYSDDWVLQHPGALIIRGVPATFFKTGAIHPLVLANIVPIADMINAYLPEMVIQLELKGLALTNNTVSISQVILWKDDTIPVYLGDLSELEAKFTLLIHFINSGYADGKKGIGYIDLRVPNKIIVNYDS